MGAGQFWVTDGIARFFVEGTGQSSGTDGKVQFRGRRNFFWIELAIRFRC